MGGATASCTIMNINIPVIAFRTITTAIITATNGSLREHQRAINLQMGR